MSIIEAVTSVLSKYATFNGRARRSEYWWFVLANCLVGSLLIRLGSYLSLFEVLSSIYSLLVILPGLAVGVRRLHDIGKSGFAYLMIFVPLVGWIFLLIWLCRDSAPDNDYGPNPKGGFGYSVF